MRITLMRLGMRSARTEGAVCSLREAPGEQHIAREAVTHVQDDTGGEAVVAGALRKAINGPRLRNF